MATPQGHRTEYQHFIPQFILRNFSHKYRPSSVNSKPSSGRRKETKLYPGEPALHVINVNDEVLQLSESPAKRTFGLMDMYQSTSNAPDYGFVEKELGKLESQVGTIIAETKKALESGKSGFSMSRHQRDTLRKFLFIMKYRGPSFHQRFYGDDSGRYNADDADHFRSYMQENGYQNPFDVWLKAIKTILHLELDLKGKWQEKLMNSIYPDDAKWFIMHMEGYFLAFCTPGDPGDEFILTENCYNIHEGPNSFALNPETGEHEVVCWSSYHEFCPITPKLILILRSFLLPNEEEDTNERMREWRRELYELNTLQHSEPARSRSKLEDLPLKKARNSYSQILADGIQLLPGEDGSRRSYHRFTFPFFKLTTNQVQRINCIFLDNAHSTSAIGFNSKSSLKRSLEYYLPLADDGYKLVRQQDNDPLFAYLRKLELLANSLGSRVAMTYQKAPRTSDMEQLREESLRRLQRDMLDHLPEQPTEFMQLYNALGGTHDTLFTDFDQVRKMRFLRIKIDVVTQGRCEAMREKVRINLRDLFCQQVPPRRLWMYLKSLRITSLGSPETLDETLAPHEAMDGPEDVIVKASRIVRPECLGFLLHFTVMQDIQHRKNPGINPSDFNPDETSLVTAQAITRLAFSSVGSICNCGIKPIQKCATSVSNMLRVTKEYEHDMNHLWSVDENIEILTRAKVRAEMTSLLSGALPQDTLEELNDVLFDVVYPTYRRHQRIR